VIAREGLYFRNNSGIFRIDGFRMRKECIAVSVSAGAFRIHDGKVYHLSAGIEELKIVRRPRRQTLF